MAVETISIILAIPVADLIVITVISSAAWSAEENKTLTILADNRFNYGQSSEIELTRTQVDCAVGPDGTER